MWREIKKTKKTISIALAKGAVIIVGNAFVYIRHPRLIRTFRRTLGYWPNVCYPQTKNEKFLWRKTFDRNPMHPLLADKLTVRQFIKSRCPDLAMSEIIWIGVAPEQIPETLLQPGVVIKTNNGCNRNIFITTAPVDRAQINQLVIKWLACPYGTRLGEWHYARISPVAFIEKLLALPGDPQFVEISCHVLKGECVFVTVEANVKQENERIAHYDGRAHGLSINSTDRTIGQPKQHLPEDFPIPARFKEAVQYAETIAADFDYIRVDFMSPGKELYFCECTVFPMSGLSVISARAEHLINTAWDLRNSWFMQQPQRGLNGVYRKLYDYCLKME